MVRQQTAIVGSHTSTVGCQGGNLSHFDRGTDAKVEKARTRAPSGSRRTDSIRRAFTVRRRRTIGFLASAMLLGSAAIAIAGPSGEWLEGGDQATGGVVKFGPINPVNGFPDWYRDSNGIEVEPCLSNFDPNCNAPTPAPDPSSEVSFPDNFPDEFFYFTGEASLTANGGNDVLALYTIEGTYGGGNTQTVFGRTRYRIRGGLVPGAEYKVTNPYGVDTLVAGDDSAIFVTDDVGVGSGNFGGLFEGQVGPFLKWDSDKPAHYLGDPTVPHTVTGSPFGHNFVKIEGPNVGGPANPNPCPGLDADTSPNCIYTDLFSILGKESTRGGVEVARASYSLAAGAGAKPQIDVMAESKAAQDIVAQDTIVGSGRRFQVTPLATEQSRYFTHLNVQGALPDQIDVINRSDVPQTVKHVKVTDHVTGTALYDADTDKLHVQAESSDKTMPLTDLSVTGVGPAAAMNAAGAADITTTAPTATVNVTSKKGGSAVVPVSVRGSGLPALPLAANAGGDQSVEQGVEVTLNGATSTGNIDAYEWTGPGGIAITGASSPVARFTAPSAPGDYEFTLKVTGPDGSSGAVTSKTDTVIVHVNEISAAVAKIAFANAVIAPGATITVPQNQSITLDGGQSVGAAAFSWSQVSGPAVSLGATNGQTATFTVPKTAQDIKLALQVRNPGVAAQNCTATSCSTTEITLRPQPDALAITTARFVANGSRWRIDGTATSTTNNRVTVYSGLALNPALRIGTADVLADGTWSVDARDSTIPVTTCQCVTVVSDRGGQIVDFPLEKPQNLPPATVDPGDPPAQTLALRGTAPLAAAVPLAGTALATARFAAPAAFSAASVATTGVPVTVAVPTGATIVRLRVLTTANRALFSTFRKVKGGTKVKMTIRSAKLRTQLRSGRRYVLEVRAGTAKNRLGKPTRKAIRMR
jgi:hypothetical protein